MRIAVLLPCYNEEPAIAQVVADFRTALPQAVVYVYDNASTDKTAQVAQTAGAVVRHEPLKGKGNVVRRMFADIEADVYLMADGDGTYEAKAAPRMISSLLDNNADMVVGIRSYEDDNAVYRRGHRFGNRMLNRVVHVLFDKGMSDMLSGYRAFSRRFVKSFPALARGFETETELTMHALQMHMPVYEVPTRYFKRAKGTQSKLSTYKDGIRILNFIIFFFKEARPFEFFGGLTMVLVGISLILGMPLVFDYFETGLVPRFPTAILSMGLMLMAAFTFLCGIILDSVSRSRQEKKRFAYLSYPSLAETVGDGHNIFTRVRAQQ